MLLASVMSRNPCKNLAGQFTEVIVGLDEHHEHVNQSVEYFLEALGVFIEIISFRADDASNLLTCSRFRSSLTVTFSSCRTNLLKSIMDLAETARTLTHWLDNVFRMLTLSIERASVFTNWLINLLKCSRSRPNFVNHVNKLAPPGDVTSKSLYPPTSPIHPGDFTPKILSTLFDTNHPHFVIPLPNLGTMESPPLNNLTPNFWYPPDSLHGHHLVISIRSIFFKHPTPSESIRRFYSEVLDPFDLAQPRLVI